MTGKWTSSTCCDGSVSERMKGMVDQTALVNALLSRERKASLTLVCPRNHALLRVWEIPGGLRVAASRQGREMVSVALEGEMVRCSCRCNRPGFAWYEVRVQWVLAERAPRVALVGEGADSKWQFVRQDARA